MSEAIYPNVTIENNGSLTLKWHCESCKFVNIECDAQPRTVYTCSFCKSPSVYFAKYRITVEMLPITVIEEIPAAEGVKS